MFFDDLAENIEGARARGLTAVHVTSPDDVAGALAALGILGVLASVALMPVADALAAVLAGVEPLPEEMVALDAAHHRVLARDVAALRTQPPQAMSAMDGYAVRSADAAQVAARLKVIGEVAAGRPFDSKVGAGEAVRIFTGGVIPEGADAVIIQEDTVADGEASPSRKPRAPDGISAPPASTFAKAMCCCTRGTPPHRPRSRRSPPA